MNMNFDEWWNEFSSSVFFVTDCMECARAAWDYARACNSVESTNVRRVDDLGMEWFEKLWAYYNCITVTNRQGHVPSSSKIECKKKFFDIVKSGIDPEVLCIAVECYVNKTLGDNNYIVALATVIGKRRPYYLEYIDDAKALLNGGG